MSTSAEAVGRAPAPTVSRSLWRHRDFMVYWFGQTISRGGVQIAEFVLPLTAIAMFHATSQQLGWINAIAFAPYLTITLLAGVWIDRRGKRTILVTAELGRVVALSIVPLVAVFGTVRLYDLYIVAGVMGVCAVLFDVSGTAYLPSLVSDEQLLDGNSRLQATIVVTQSGGAALGGLLVQLSSAAVVLGSTLISPLASLAALALIRHREPPVVRADPRRRPIAEIAESLRYIRKDVYLRFLMVRSGVNNLFFTARNTVLPLFVLQVLHLGTALLGLILGVGAVGALVGATFAKKLADRLGAGRVIAVGYGVASTVQILLPLAGGPPPLALAIVLPMFFTSGMFITVGNTNVATFQQMLIPRRQLGRAVAAMRTVTWGTMPLGALIGGSLGSVIGIRQTLFVTAAGFFASALWIALSPIAKLRAMPEPPGD
ncbi:MAG: MFS transporter [Catenulispora sp.]